jgi:hypothetical protein
MGKKRQATVVGRRNPDEFKCSDDKPNISRRRGVVAVSRTP